MSSPADKAEQLSRVLSSFAGNVEAEGLRWMFQLRSPNIQALLDWLSSSLRESNVVSKYLTQEELSLCNTLKAENKYLETEEIQRASSQVRCFAEDESLESIEQNIGETEEHIILLQRRINQLVNQRDLFVDKGFASYSEDPGPSSVPDKLPETLRSLDQLNAQINDSLNSLRGAVAQALQLRQSPGAPKTQGHSGSESGKHSNGGTGSAASAPPSSALLMHTDVRGYVAADERFIGELGAFLDRQFHSGLAQLSSGLAAQPEHPSVWELLHSARPESVLIAGEGGGSRERARAELQRLQMAGADAEAQLARAQVSTARMAAAVEEATAQERLASREKAALTAGDARRQIAELREALARCCAATNRLVGPHDQSEAASLAGTLSWLLSTRVFLRDSSLKLQRLRYHAQKQQIVVSHLLGQQGRHRVVLGLMEQEQERHRQLKRLLQATAEELERRREAFAARTQDLRAAAEHLRSTPSRITATAVDGSGDTATGGAAAAGLGVGEGREVRLTVDDRDGYVLRAHELLLSGDRYLRGAEAARPSSSTQSSGSGGGGDGGGDGDGGLPPSSSSSSSYVEWAQVAELAGKAVWKRDSLLELQRCGEQEARGAFDAQRRNVAKLQASLRSHGRGDVGAVPLLTPPAILKALEEQTRAKSLVADRVKALVQQRSARKRDLHAQSPLQRAHRSLFCSFFNQPDALLSHIQQLQQRVAARSVGPGAPPL